MTEISKANFLNINNDNVKWNKMFVQNEFIELYFKNLGINDSLLVENLNIYGLSNYNSDEKLHFLIIPTKIYEKGKTKKKKLPNEKISKTILMFPEKITQYDDSINFLSLAYSGLFNIDEKSDLFKRKDHKRTMIECLIQRMKWQHEESSKFDELDEFFKADDEIRAEHNKYTYNFYKDRLDSFELSNEEDEINNRQVKSSYSLIFQNEFGLFEYRPHSKEVIEISGSISQSSMGKTITEYLKKENQENAYKFNLETLITFKEVTKKNEPEKNENNTIEILITLLLTILFIINFLNVVPENKSYSIGNAYSSYMEFDTQFNNIFESVKTNANLIYYIIPFNVGAIMSMDNKFNNAPINNKTDGYLSTNMKIYKLLGTNKFSGIKFNFKFNDREPITDYNGNIREKRKINVNYEDAMPIDIPSDRLWNLQKNSDNPFDVDTFSLYLKPTLNPNQLQTFFKDLTRILKDSRLYQVSLTMLVYSSVTNFITAYYNTFYLSTFGVYIPDKISLSYQYYINQSNDFIKIIILFMLCNFLFIYTIGKMISNLYKNINELIKSKVFNFSGSDLIDIVFFIFFLRSQFSFLSLFIISGSTDVSLSHEEDFDITINKINDAQSYGTTTGLTMFILSIKIILVLNKRYPLLDISYKLVLNTAKIFGALCVILFCTLIGFFVNGHSLFGTITRTMSSLGSAFTTTILMFTGTFDSEDMTSFYYSTSLATIFYIIFTLYFNMIFLNLYFCILRNNYSNFKNVLQIIEANSLMTSDENYILSSKFLNLIFFKNPVLAEKELHLKLKGNSDQGEENQIEDKKEKKVEEENDVSIPKIGLIDTFKYHLKKIKLKEIFSSPSISKEELIEKINQKFKVIMKIRVLKLLDELEIDFEKEFDNLVSIISHCIFIIFFVLLLFIQLKFQTRVEKQTFLNFFKNDIVNIYGMNEAQSNIKITLSKFYNLTEYKNNCNSDNNWKIFKNEAISEYVVLNPPYIRFTFRLFDKIEKNTKPWDDKFFSSSQSEFIINECPNNNERVARIVETGKSSIASNLIVEYTEAGNINSADSCGGFVILLNKMFPYCDSDANLVDTFKYLFDDFPSNKQIASVVFDMGFFSLNSEYAVYYKESFSHGYTGYITHSMEPSVVPLNGYSTSSDFWRMVLELIYVFYFVLNFINFYSGDFEEILEKNIMEDYSQDDNKKPFANSNLLGKFYRLEFSSESTATIGTNITKLFKLIFRIFIRTIFLLIVIIKSTWTYMGKNSNYFIKVLNIFIRLISIIIWLSIISLTLQIDFNFYNTPPSNIEDSKPSNIAILNQLSKHYYNYQMWQAFNIITVLLILIGYLRKTWRRFNLLLKAIDTSIQPIYYHFLHIIIISLGFSLLAFSIFNNELYELSSIKNAFAYLNVVTTEDKELLTNMIPVNSTAGHLFFMVYAIYFVLMLNILWSIIIESYIALKAKEKDNIANNVSIFTTIKKILKKKNILILNTLNVYDINIRDYLQKSNKLKKSIVAGMKEIEIEGVMKHESFFSILKNLNTAFKVYLGKLLSILNDIDSLTKKGLRVKHKLFLQKFVKNENKKPEDRIEPTKRDLILRKKYISMIGIKTGKVSCFVKMWIYIKQVIIENPNKIFRKELENLSKNKNKNNNENNLKIKKEIKIPRLKEIFIMKEDEGNSVETFYKDNPYHEMIMKEFKNNINEKAVSYFKPTLFEKFIFYGSKYQYNSEDKNLQEDIKIKDKTKESYRYSYETRNFSKNSLSDQVFYNRPSKVNNTYNVRKFKCNIKCHLKKDIKCQQCIIVRKYFNSISVNIYDLLVKDFYKPEVMYLDSKDIYIAYYLYVSKLLKLSTSTQFLLASIPQIKRFALNNEIQFIKRMEKFSKFKVKNIIFSRKNEYELDEETKFTCFLEENFNQEVDECLNKEEFKILMTYYKYFTIWNSLYLILFRKNKNFLRKVHKHSETRKIIENEKDEEYNSVYKKLFTHLLNFKNRTFEIEDYIDLVDNNIEVTLLTFFKYHMGLVVDNNEKDFDEIFFENVIRRCINDNSSLNFNDVFPKDPRDKINYEVYPFVFFSLWKSFSLQEKFNLFYGYSIWINDKNRTLDDLINSIYSNDRKFYIHELFTSSHRAQILTMYKMNEKFVNSLEKIFRKVAEENSDFVLNIPTIKSINNIKSLMIFFRSLQTNYLIVNDFFKKLFDDHLKNVKNYLNKKKNEIQRIFFVMKNDLLHLFKDSKQKIDFNKNFQLYFIDIMFYEILEILRSDNNNNMEEIQFEDEDKLEMIKLMKQADSNNNKTGISI